MSKNQIWPIDKLGNEIRTGDLLHLKLDQDADLFYVLNVSPASVLHTAEGAMPVNGEIEVVLKFKLPFAPDHRQMFKGMVVKQPDGLHQMGSQEKQ